MSGISISEDRRKERTRAPPNFWEGGTGGPACETSLNGLKAGMGRGARAPPIVWEGGGGTGDPAYVRHLWIYNMPARIGGRRGHVPLPTFERGGGGTDGPACVRHLWMDSNRGPRKEGTHAPSNFNNGAQVCLYPWSSRIQKLIQQHYTLTLHRSTNV